MSEYRFWLVVVVLIAVFTGWINLPSDPATALDKDRFTIVQGLDLQGGSRVLLRAAINVDSEDMDVATGIIDQRVNGLGLTEAVVQRQGSDRIIVELPGISDRELALQAVQGTGLLEFVNFANVNALQFDGACILTDEQVRLREERALRAEEPQPSLPESPVEPTLEATAASPFGKPALQQTPTAEPTGEPTPEATSAATAEPTAETTPVVTETPTEEPVAQAPEGPRGPCPDGSYPLGVDGLPALNATGEIIGQPFQTAEAAGIKLTGEVLDDARELLAENNRWYISFTLSDQGDEAFADFTGNNIGNPMAIVLDGVVISAPTIQARITGSGQITGDFTRDEARVLAAQLRYGALPVPLEVEAFDTVGPTLGEISIQRSVRAGVIGIIVVFLFMITYYRVPGIAAVLALLLFISINFALYKAIPVTLTLPAITGFLISVGTAVDGNILIFERMKEELRAGRTLENAARLGFERAWNSIRDSNLSSILIALILFFFGATFGASAVQGFAITLILGLITNLFTAVIVTRTFLSLFLDLFGEQLRHNRRLFGA